jgi:cyclophilin family peptidyl-prolyl cis-trans isomerase
LIQGGDLYATGVGTPGFGFATESHPDDDFNREGLIAMANAGPVNLQSNTSQFFITFAPMPDLNGHYTLFGELVKGQDVLHELAKMPMNRFQTGVHAPNMEIKMKKVRAYKIDAQGKATLAEMDKSVALPPAKIPVIPGAAQ